jgi:hypothetical protein
MRGGYWEKKVDEMLLWAKTAIPRNNVNQVLPNVVFEREQQQMRVDEAKPARLVEAIFLALSSALDDAVDVAW